MANYQRLIAALDDMAKGWLPPSYAFGMVVPHDTHLSVDDDDFETTGEDLEHLDRHSAIKLAEHRRDAIRYGREFPGTVTPADVSALPTTGRYIIAEIVHQPTGIVAFRAYPYDTIRDLVTDPNRTPVQKRTAVRNALNQLFLDCQERVAAAEG